MKIVSLFFLLIISNLSYSNCREKVLDQLSGYHGASFKALLADGCNKSEIKNNLKNIITNVNEALHEFDEPAKRLVFRNALKSYGIFVESDSHGISSAEDMDVLKRLYENPDKYSHGLYPPHRLRTKILESAKEIGSLSALEFYEEAYDIHNEPSILHHSFKNIDYITNGQKEIVRNYGDRIHEENYHPNLKDSIYKRYKNIDEERVKTSLESLNSKAKDLINKTRDPKLKRMLENKIKIVSATDFKNNTNQRIIASKENLEIKESNIKKNKDIKREPNSIESKKETFNLSYLVIFALFALLLSIFFVFKRN